MEAMQDDKVKMSEEHAEGHLQDSSDDEEDVDWKDLNEETTVEDLMDRYASGKRPIPLMPPAEQQQQRKMGMEGANAQNKQEKMFLPQT